MSKDALPAASRPEVGALDTGTLTAADYATIDQLCGPSAGELRMLHAVVPRVFRAFYEALNTRGQSLAQ